MFDTMKRIRAAVLPAVVLALSACATGSMETATDQAMVSVLNDTEARYVTVSIEGIEGNTVPLGTVTMDDTETFVFRVEDEIEDYRLIAVSPGDMEREDHLVSRTFVVDGGMTVNWYLHENELEVSSN